MIHVQPGGSEFHVIPLSFSEDNAGNPLHLVLIMVTIPILTPLQRRRNDIIYYLICLLVAFVLFCAYLRWQPWNSRLHLPLFILWSVLIGLAISQVHNTRMANLIIAATMFGAIPWLIFNSSRPIIGSSSILNTSRTLLYFENRRSLIDPYTRSVQSLSHSKCTDIGLVLGGDDWEYPLWILLRQTIGSDVRIEFVDVKNASAKEYSAFPEFTPCAVLATNALVTNNFQVNGVTYSVHKSTSFITVLTPK